jgi:hypothetical protein
MKRREFLGSALATATMAGFGSTVIEAQTAALRPNAAEREYYELRAYRFKAGATHTLLDSYLEKAAIPAWNRLGIKPVGVFTEIDSKEAPVVYVLLPFPSLEAFASLNDRLQADAAHQSAGTEYLQARKANPAFERIDSWLLRAFAGMPKLELPSYSRDQKPRVFEMRTYESFSEVKALKKIEMFNSGEIEVMRQVGLAPVLYGQALTGSSLPHLTYMLSGEDQNVHKQHWNAFNRNPEWAKLNRDPQYADTVSNIKSRFLAPMPFSQI